MTNGQKKSAFVDLDGAELYYEVMGEGTPLVLIHDGFVDSRMWQPQFETFARHFEVIRYDMRGFGMSPVPRERYRPTDDLRELLTFLRVDGACLLGLSMGAAVAVDFALTHPHLVQALIPVSPGLSQYTFSEEFSQRVAKLYDTARDEGVPRAIERLLDDPQMARLDEVPGARRQMRKMVRENRHTLVLRPTKLMLPADPPAVDRLSEIHVPTLIILGDRDERDVVEIADTLEAEVSDARKVVVPDAGHMINMEKPEEFNQIVMDFLDAL